MDSAKVEPEGGATEIKTDKGDMKLWISVVITTVLFIGVGVAIPTQQKSAAEEAAESVGVTMNPVTILKNFFIGGGSGMAFHIFFMLFFMWKKKKDLAKEATKPVEQTTFTEDGQTMIYARKLTLCQKIFVLFIGTLISIVNLILSILAFVGVDLKVLFFPLPFYMFWQSRLLVSNMRIKGAKLKLAATYSDAYFLWLKIQRNNMYTCGCYAKRCNKRGYEKWLDKRLSWAGTPPPGFTNEFCLFAVRASLCDRLKLALIKFFFGAVLSACTPLTQPYVLLKSYQFELKNMIIGGKTPFFKPEFTYQAMLKTYMISLCGCRKRVITKHVDSHIDFDTSTGAPDTLDMERG